MHYIGCELYILLTLCPRLASLGAPLVVHLSTQQGLHGLSSAQSEDPSGSPKPCAPRYAWCHLSAPISQPTLIFSSLHDGCCTAIRSQHCSCPAQPSPTSRARVGSGDGRWSGSSVQPSRAALPFPFEVITSRNDKLLTNYTLSLRPDATNEISVSCFQLIPLLRK